MCARRAWPEEKYDAGERGAPGRLVSDVLGAIREHPVRRLVGHGRGHRLSGGANVGLRRRD